MTAKFRQEWISYHGRPECVPHIEELLNFVDKRKSILELYTQPLQGIQDND